MFAAAAAAAAAWFKPYSVEWSWGAGPVVVGRYRSQAEAWGVVEAQLGNAAFCPFPLFAAMSGPEGVEGVWSTAAVEVAAVAAA